MFTEEQENKIYAALKEKAPIPGPCPICGNRTWALQGSGFIFMALQKGLGNISLGGPGIPFIALHCAKCGNTMFLNILVLGLRDMVEQTKPEKVD
jgi:hypothetical protein